MPPRTGPPIPVVAYEPMLNSPDLQISNVDGVYRLITPRARHWHEFGWRLQLLIVGLGVFLCAFMSAVTKYGWQYQLLERLAVVMMPASVMTAAILAAIRRVQQRLVFEITPETFVLRRVIPGLGVWTCVAPRTPTTRITLDDEDHAKFYVPGAHAVFVSTDLQFVAELHDLLNAELAKLAGETQGDGWMTVESSDVKPAWLSLRAKVRLSFLAAALIAALTYVGSLGEAAGMFVAVSASGWLLAHFTSASSPFVLGVRGRQPLD